MKTRTFASPLALVAALALTTAAGAQTLVGNQDISDADLPEVQAHCDSLAAAGDAGGAPADDAAVDDAPAEAQPPEGLDVPAEAEDAAPGEAVGVGIDFTAITLEDCIAAGLV